MNTGLRRGMGRQRIAVGLAAVILAAGCGGRTFWANPDGGSEGIDADIQRDAATQRDATVRPDAGGGEQCEVDEWWELQATALTSVTVTSLQPSGPGMPEGVAVRLRAEVEVRGCDQLAGVQPNVDWQQRQIHLSAWVWHYRGPEDCPSMLQQVPEMFALRDLEPGGWTVHDAFGTTGPASLASFHIRACLDGEDCYCDWWDGIPRERGDSCNYDCMCQWPNNCLYEGNLDPSWGGVCEQTCSTDSDCPLPLQCVFNVLDMPEGICSYWRDDCATDADCREGHACLPWEDDPSQRFCQPDMDPDVNFIQCGDDCDCPAGYDCLQTDDTGQRYCQVPCRGNGDCPEYLTCEDPGGWWLNNRTCGGWYL